MDFPARRALTAAVLAAALLSACGGKTVKPGSSLDEAEAAVARAERARIADYDAASWRAAKENLLLARSNSASKDTEAASRWYAARAKADAEVGIARSERARLYALNQSLKREISQLQSAATPPAITPVTPATGATP